VSHSGPTAAPGHGRPRDHRQRQIAEVLVRHGLTYLASVLGLERLVAIERGLLGREPRHSPTRPEDLRLALEELGPTFIKLGQLLSTRADVLPSEYRNELEKLQDAAPPVAAEVIQNIIASELHTSASSAFATFDVAPLACASIGQAHVATLHDGTDVVVKVRRPGVVEEMEQDLEIVQNFAARANRRSRAGARYDLVGLADEFVQTLRGQLDYLQEGRNAERFAANFEGDPSVQIPRVFWDLTTSRVITLERIRGMKITDRAALDEVGLDRHALAERAAQITAKMVFEDGFFHADPHPGNFFVEPTGRIGIVDFGMVGALDDQSREQLGRLLTGFLRQDPDRLASALLALGISKGPVDRARLREDLANLLARYFGRSLGEISLRSALGDVLEIVRRHRLRVPRDLALLFTVIIIDEGLTADVDPDFRFAGALAPFARRQLVAQLSPATAVRRVEQFGMDVAELAIDLPGRVNRLLGAVEAGGLEVHLRTDELDALLGRTERLGNRIAASVLAAAVIDGLGQVVADRRRRRRALRPQKLGVGLGALGTIGAYVASRWAIRRREPDSSRRRS
jgi:ubiquinone biosynthesis protein